jgi:Ni/Co efflux regulator RcnB
MKKLLALLVASCVLASPVMAADKKPAKAPVKKEVKHHKKAEGTEIAGTKPDTVTKKK